MPNQVKTNCLIGNSVQNFLFMKLTAGMLGRGTDIRTIQALLGQKDIATTMIYTHVLQQGGHGVASPLDDL